MLIRWAWGNDTTRRRRKNMFNRWKCWFECWFEWHNYEEDSEPINGAYNRFCRRCGHRQIRILGSSRWIDYR